jgi:ParB family chromosome partitioning protein
MADAHEEARNQRRGGLGRGLAALIPPGEKSGITLQEIPLSAVQPNPRQPRGVFDEEEIEGLATSIRDMGVLQPIVVRPLGDERFELVAGERRLRAAKLAGLTRISAVIRHTDDDALLKEALVENIHRVQLNALEEAAAYEQLLDDFGVTQEELAQRLGKSRPTITNALRLLSLPPAIQRKVAAGVLSAGHAKALLAIPERADQERLADRIVAEGMSVRATEEYVRFRLLDEADDVPERGTGGAGSGGGTKKKTSRLTAPGLIDLQDDLSDALRARVKISMGARKGTIRIEFGSVDDLERIVGVIAKGLQTDIGVDRP